MSINLPFHHDRALKTGVLLVNLGTPDAATAAAVRRYLVEFLSDRRVVELPAWFWRPLLRLLIAPLRARRVAHAYRAIWTDQGSPLRVYSQRLADQLQLRLGQDRCLVRLAMRYGQPSVASVLEEFAGQQVSRLLVLPLYPQYSATTTASVIDAVCGWAQKTRWIPEIRTVSHYYDRSGWQRAVADSIRAHQHDHGQPDRLLFSFHGIPQRYVTQGDPYYCQCLKSARRIAAALGIDEQDYQVTFQSRVGREPWLRPYTDQVLQELPGQGVKRIQVVCPGFAVDCLETLEEIAMQNRDGFLEAGGDALEYIPALNDSAAHADLLYEIVQQHIHGWPEPADQSERRRAERFERHGPALP